MFKPKTILVPTDFSECGGDCSMYAVKNSVDIAKQHGSNLIFLHVVAEDIYRKPMFFLDDDKIDNLNEKIHEHSKNQVMEIIDKYASEIKDRCSIIVRDGKPYTEILNEAVNSKVDLIVIATRGIHGLQGVFYGSVTEKVVRHAECSVLVVRKSLNIN